MSEEATKKISRRALLKGGALAAGAAVALPALGSSLGQAAVSLPMRYASTKKTTISLVGLFFIPSELAAARQIINEFNAQSKTIYVQYVQSGWGAIGSKMTADFSSGDVPDLFQYYDAGLVPWAENGLLTNLKDLLPASTWANVVPGTLSVLTTANGVAGLPFETETPLVYYRPDLFTKAGITPATLANPLDMGTSSWRTPRSSTTPKTRCGAFRPTGPRLRSCSKMGSPGRPAPTP